MNKKPASYKLAPKAIDALSRLTELEGRSRAEIIEDAVLKRLAERQENDLADRLRQLEARVAALEYLLRATPPARAEGEE